jgi:AraC-like DNA-binding protein
LIVVQLRRAIEYFESHLAQDIALKDVSMAVKLLQSRFARGFKSSTGVSLYRGYTNARIKKTRKLMVENEFPLKSASGSISSRIPLLALKVRNNQFKYSAIGWTTPGIKLHLLGYIQDDPPEYPPRYDFNLRPGRRGAGTYEAD